MNKNRNRFDLTPPLRFQADNGEVIVDGYYLDGPVEDCVSARVNIELPHTITLAYNLNGQNRFDYPGWDIDLRNEAAKAFFEAVREKRRLSTSR